MNALAAFTVHASLYSEQDQAGRSLMQSFK